MKQHLPLLLAAILLLSLNSCQHEPATKKTIATSVETTSMATAPVPIMNIDTSKLTIDSPQIPDIRDFIAMHDIGNLLMQNAGHPVSPFNGFIGSDHYRIEIAFTKVVRDSIIPTTYWVEGKTRLRKNILPFKGSLAFDKLVRQPRVTEQEQIAFATRGVYENVDNSFSAIGHFILKEDSLSRNAGVFEGDIFVDFAVDQSGLFIHEQSPYSASKTGGITFEGSWTSSFTKKKKPVACAYYIWSYGESVLSNFNVGERGPEINPKYAKLGWDTYWENDEWWAEPGTAITAQAKQ